MTHNKNSYNQEYRTVLLHSITSFVGQQSMQVVDLLFCRNLGSSATATVGTATSLIAWFMVLGIGLVSSLEYFIPHSIGAKDEERTHSYFYTGVLVAILVALASMAGLLGLAHFSSLIGINDAIRRPVEHFCQITAVSYFAIFLVPIFRVELQARGHSHDTTWAFIFANLLNILLNWAFVLGNLGFDAHGTVGSAWASLLARFFLLLFLFVRVSKVRAGLTVSIHWLKVKHRQFAVEILKMGIPTSLHMLFEMGAFIFVSTVAANLSSVQTASHTIVITIASFAFMIPLGMSSAASLTISKAIGQKNGELARHYAKLTIQLGLLYACIGSLVIILFRQQLMQFYTIDEATIELGKKILIIAAIFQFGDAMQVILSGILRGVGETRVQAKMNALGHWFIGVPFGMWLAFRMEWGVAGLWIGLCVGLCTVAIGLAICWKKIKISNRLLNEA